MRRGIPLSLAAILLFAAPVAAGASVLRVAGSGGQPNFGGSQQDDQDSVSDAQVFSIVAGQILGAASACQQIDSNRVSAATLKAVIITKASAQSQEDLDVSRQAMLHAADSGRLAVKNGGADCKRVSVSFTKLEQVEQTARQQQSQLDEDDQDQDAQ